MEAAEAVNIEESINYKLTLALGKVSIVLIGAT